MKNFLSRLSFVILILCLGVMPCFAESAPEAGAWAAIPFDTDSFRTAGNIVTLGAYEPENTELWYLTDYETRQDLTNLQVAPRSVPAVFRRRPMCRRVLHFTMKLVNSNLNEDFELVGAQVFYNLQGRLR